MSFTFHYYSTQLLTVTINSNQLVQKQSMLLYPHFRQSILILSVISYRNRNRMNHVRPKHLWRWPGHIVLSICWCKSINIKWVYVKPYQTVYMSHQSVFLWIVSLSVTCVVVCQKGHFLEHLAGLQAEQFVLALECH